MSLPPDYEGQLCIFLCAALCQVGYIVAAGMLRRLANVFSLFDQPMKDAARPVPPYVLQVM